jgi:very-short-patch-repair endonuclease
VETPQRDYEADCLWRPERLIVELDSRTFHDTLTAFERDRERDRRLAVAGWRTMRITWRQLTGEPHNVLTDLAALLTTTPRDLPSPRSHPSAPGRLVAGP